MLRSALFAFVLLSLPFTLSARESDADFFESKIRPLLAKRCYSCHSKKAKKLQGGLYLDRADGAIKGGESGPAIVLAKPDESLLIRAIRYEENEMPPDAKLPAGEIALLVKWVEMGAPWPAAQPGGAVKSATGYDWNEIRSGHWSFRPVKKPALPETGDSNWPRSELDRFILARLEQAGMAPADPAEPRVLVRRVYLDLVGLPPTPEQVDHFIAAAREDRQSAVSALVDQLLDSPHYGERWGRHWLDVARYSDGHGGFLDNKPNNDAWRYRDWVVAAFNEDLAYNQFVKLQIAGDLTGDQQAAVATGFFALGPAYHSDGGDPDSVAQAKSETLDDRMDTFSRGFLGLTVACARCHDHKFDPIPQQDYYSVAGIFNNSSVWEFPLASDEVVKAFHDRQNTIVAHIKKIKDLQKKAKDQQRDVNEEEKARIAQWNKNLAELRKTAPPKYPVAHALHDTGSGNMKVAIRGNLRKPGEEAPRRFLRILAGDQRALYTKGSGRAELADAITDASNPLTARVIVNRVWLHHFGKALVRSPSNFGTLGEKPTHPLLLDWLAATFVESGWSLKLLHRRIMTSAAYQMSSQVDEKNFDVDGDNRWLWRVNPRRMDVEVWRDSLLAVTGELDLTFGGPPIGNLANTNRRTLYAKVSRNGDVFASDTFLRLFDFPIMRATVAKRPTSIVPQQFLFMMNSPFMVARAKALTARLERESSNNDERIQLAYRLLFGRQPTEQELQLGLNFLAATSGEAGIQSSPAKIPTSVQYAQTLLSSNEFMFVR